MTDIETVEIDGQTYERHDNITDHALREFQNHYEDAAIDKDAIFYYTYGLLHQPDYRDRFANNLRRELPRLPFAPDFWTFAKQGERLAAIHLDFSGEYGVVAEYELEYDEVDKGEEAWLLSAKRMRWGGSRNEPDKTRILFPEGGIVSGIPAGAHEYVVNGRTPLEWAMDQYRIKEDKASGIVNDPNAWWAERGGPRAILPYLARLVSISLETSEIVRSLPPWE